MRWDRIRILLSALVCLTLAEVSLGGFTFINPPHPGEDSHQQILSEIYGGAFVPSGTRGVDFSNGSTLAFRIDDFLNGGDDGDPLDMGPTGGLDETDQTWQATFTGARAEAVFAQFEQTFGYIPGTDGGVSGFIELFEVEGTEYNVDGEANVPLIPGSLLRWGRGGEDRIVSSLMSDNEDGLDHMVTYQILSNPTDGGGGEPQITWLVFFEDIFDDEPFEDFDFNDLAVQIQAIPEPGTLLGAAGLLGALALKRRRD